MIVWVLYYADDFRLFSPSHKGLQKLLDICNELGVEIDIKFYELKTLCMVFSIANVKKNEVNGISI